MKLAKSLIRTCLPVIIAVVLLAITLTSIGNLSGGSREQEKQQLEDALRRASLACYAARGFYPPDLDYIVSKYGIQINSERFAVFYEIFAENIMPDINVVVLDE